MTAYTAALQAQLKSAGYYTGEVDGIYGPLTVDAVQKLQTEAGLPTTGVVDKATALALDKKLASTSPSTPQPQSQTAAVQTVLKLTGYWTGPVDGIWTDAAHRRVDELPDAPSASSPPAWSTRPRWLPGSRPLAEAQSAAATTTTTSGAVGDDDQRRADHHTAATTTTTAPTTTSTTAATTTSTTS